MLGCGEHLALPQLAALASGPATLVSSTTRSPAKVCDAPGYPLRDGLAFPHPEDPAIAGFAYNVRPRRGRTSSCTSPSRSTGARPTACCARWPRARSRR